MCSGKSHFGLCRGRSSRPGKGVSMVPISLVDTRQSISRKPPGCPPRAPTTSSLEPSRPEVVVSSLALNGLESLPLCVHVHLEPGSNSVRILGLAEPRVRETRARLHAALRALGRKPPAGRITVRFELGQTAPRGLEPSAANDVAVVIGVLATSESFNLARLRGTAFVGEISLSGTLRGVRGALPMVRGAGALGFARVVFPQANALEVSVCHGIRTDFVSELRNLVAHLEDGRDLKRASEVSAGIVLDGYDFSDIPGPPIVRRALEIAAAGRHGLLLVGPPESGKLSWARRLPGILPDFGREEALDVTSIHSVAGLLGPEGRLLTTAPFRAPHSSVSPVGLVGGGVPVRPGEVTLAHHGVLVLDQVLDFRASTLSQLSDVLRNGEVAVFRADVQTRFPARPLLVCTANPCPCARRDEDDCVCTPDLRDRYCAGLDGLFPDRLDIRVALHPLDAANPRIWESKESSAIVRGRVTTAQSAQRIRAKKLGTAATNGMLALSDVKRVAILDVQGSHIFSVASTRLGFTDLAGVRVLRVARTIADLAESESVLAPHLLEALELTRSLVQTG
ncbi:MAG: ATP-binding protein [Polyangiaceae bacterium]